MLTQRDVEEILRDDIKQSRDHLKQSLNAFLQLAGKTSAGVSMSLENAARDHSDARLRFLMDMHQLNEFLLFGTVPENISESLVEAVKSVAR